MRKLKILHTVETYTPVVSGMSEVVSQISERLVEMGHEVTVATRKVEGREAGTINGVKVVEFAVSDNFVRGLKGEVTEYRDFLLESNFDIITNFAAQQWATDIALPILPQIKAKRVFVPTGFSEFYHPYYQDYFDLMKNWIKNYDMNLFLSDDYRDINFARENGVPAERIMIVPNAADEREFLSDKKINIRKDLRISDDDFLILTVGSHTGLKGHREAIEIFQRARISNATLLIVGNVVEGGCTDFCQKQESEFNQLPENIDKNKKLIVRSLTRPETVSAYKCADLFLFPSNIECSPIVLFEAMAAKTPFLATDVGNSVEISKWFESGGEILPTIKAGPSANSYADVSKSAEVLEQLYSDSERRSRMAKRGFEIWKQRYSWEKVAEEYARIYKQLGESPRKENLLPDVDVIVVARKSEIWLKRALSRIQNQTYLPKQIIAVNAGINRQLFQEALHGYTGIPIKLVEGVQNNLSNARNEGLKYSQAEYVVYCDDEDLWDKYLLESELTQIVSNPENGMVYRYFGALSVNKNFDERLQNYELGMGIQGNCFSKLLYTNKINSTISGVLLPRARLLEVGGFNSGLPYSGDWDMWLRIAEHDSVGTVFDYTEVTDHLRSERAANVSGEGRLEEQLKIYQVWADKVTSRDVFRRWASFITWRITSDFGSKHLIQTINNVLPYEIRKKMFPQTFGSARLHAIAFLSFKYLKSCLSHTKAVLSATVNIIKQISFLVIQ